MTYRSLTLAQAEHVFLLGNDLPVRWRGRAQFTVCETGFGIGLNFLALWQAWRTDRERSSRLHMVSFEAQPLPRHTLAAGLASLIPSGPVYGLAQALVQQWPPLLPGVHRFDFDEGKVSLTLAFGDACVMVEALSFTADAFFLDGFAPRRPLTMGTPALIQALAKHADAGATVATWCSAGVLQRALQEAGFAVQRRPGFGAKTQMTVATYHGRSKQRSRPWPNQVVVVGAGLAGAAIAQALQRRGVAVLLVEARGAVPIHAGHVAAALTPRVTGDDSVRARLSRAGCLRAKARWGALGSEAQPWVCGTVQVPRRDRPSCHDRLVAELAALKFPPAWVRYVEADEASALAGLPVASGGLFFSDGMLIRPPALIEALTRSAGISLLTARVRRLTYSANEWRLHTVAGADLATPTVILANAFDALAVLRNSGLIDALPHLKTMRAVVGEVTGVPASVLRGGPRCIVSGAGYVLPAVAGWCMVGSTYAHGLTQPQITADGQRTNLAKAAALLGEPIAADLAAMPVAAWPGWAGCRAVLPGSLPVFGSLPDVPGVYVATGFASHGLSWAALAGDVIAAQLCGEPLPLEIELLAAVAPR
jgi:tRNA 5-methylaminomethyl-2-thiouridine biosynthesis bifunctional protein